MYIFSESGDNMGRSKHGELIVQPTTPAPGMLWVTINHSTVDQMLS